ncbi:Receptor L-domain domain-containing protein [Caenorhabditis elegans]|uniref:Receptor L-domain domain-containing protein n=1 Tax=Caenorhabditis elegans TaxID=6239 RepID=G5EDS6_CAEEL|nr:Receptor L-domain domain-containing protein [Caenorhabditis elegans]CAA94679.2 Receptor L-domain domain-containing protein [Caenorhabditis elegans]|eukprot:NP_501840.2 Insulin/EGF-Receptor L Domain protein [Caenorhabditis elegans]
MFFHIFMWLFYLSEVDSDNCSFNVHYITKESLFPTECSQIIGRFRIDQNSEMKSEQLITLFKNVLQIRGVLQIWNTQLTSAPFMKNIQNITGDPLDKGLSILNNTKLNNLNISSLSNSNNIVEIKNNPNLNLQKMCSIIHEVFFTRRSISKNLFDCGCEIHGNFQWPQVKNFPENCIVLYGNIIIDGNAPPVEVLYRLSTVNKLYGFIQIKSSNLETLGFLQNLDEIESGIEADYTINIDSNNYLSRLDLIKLKTIKSKNSNSDISLFQNTKLCLDPEFLQTIAQSSLRKLEGYQSMSFCGMDKINNPLTYCTGKLTAVPDRCTRYIGNILFENYMTSDYEDITNYTKISQVDMKRVQQFEVIFGTIYIQGTTLKSFTLPNLQEIYQVEDIVNKGSRQLGPRTVIEFRRNDFLKDISFPNLKIAYSLITFNFNGNLTMDDDFCRKMSNGVKRVTVGLDVDYDCRPYLVDVTTTTNTST